MCRICRTRRCPDMIRVSAGQAVLIHVGMMSCQVEQACLCCREVARLHEVVQGRMTAGTFVQQACSESVAVSGAHKSLVSVLRAAQVCSVSIVSRLINIASLLHESHCTVHCCRRPPLRPIFLQKLSNARGWKSCS